MSVKRTTIINTPEPHEVVTREIYRESDSVAGWLVAGLIAIVVIVGGLFLWANRTNDQAQIEAAALSAHTAGLVEGSQVGMNAAGGAAADSAARASQAAVDATVAARNAQEASQSAIAPAIPVTSTPVEAPPNP